MTITYQAPDALLHVVNPYLKGHTLWADRVYSKFATEAIIANFNLWVVCRVLSDVANNYRGDRDSRSLVLAVQAVGTSSADCERASAKIYELLHRSGVHDRGSISIGEHSEWEFTSVLGGRAIRLVPNKQYGTRFFENGYQFDVTMEAKNGYV